MPTRPSHDTTPAVGRAFGALVVAGEAVVLILAVVVLGIPEARTAPVHVVLAIVWSLLAVQDLWQTYRFGLLGMTIGEIFRTSHRRPRTTLLSGAAMLVGGFAVVYVR